MTKGNSRYISIIHFIVDLAILNLMYYILWHYFGIDENIDFLINNYIILNGIWLLIVGFYYPYRTSRLTVLKDYIYNQFGLLFIFYILYNLSILAISSDKLFVYSMQVPFLGILLSMSVWKTFLFFALTQYRRRGFNYRNAVIVGYGRASLELEKVMEKDSRYGYRFLGYFDDEFNGEKKLGGISELKDYCLRMSIDEIYCCIPYLENKQLREIIDFGEDNHLNVRIVTDFGGFSSNRIAFNKLSYIPVMSISFSPLQELFNRVVKRGFDIIVSLLFLGLTIWWLFPIISIAIKLNSRGSIFFTQIRTGERNRSFKCIKFRTMIDNDVNTFQATKNDPRITRVGRFLRRISFDEIPQFFNVLFGQMSIVGPRPHMVEHTDDFRKTINKFMARHLIKPGITGLAQVKGYRGELKDRFDLENRIKYDRFYVENWSLGLDLAICLTTLAIIFKGDEKAY